MSVQTIEAHRAVPHEEAHRLLRETAPVKTPNVEAPVLLRDADDGHPLGLVLRCDPDLLASLRRAARSYPMTTTLRSNGVHNRSSTFGFSSRNAVLRREGCRECNSATEAPEAHAALTGAAPRLAAMLEAEMPDLVKGDRDTASAILPEWRMHGTQWTSGVLNETSPLPYHYDANNLPTWNAMVVMRRATRGGHFHIPEYDVTLPCRDGDVCFFPAYHLLHGVTPIRLVEGDGYRYTAVYYTVRRMQECLPWEEELAHGRATRSTREDTLLERQRASGLLGPPE